MPIFDEAIGARRLQAANSLRPWENDPIVTPEEAASQNEPWLSAPLATEQDLISSRQQQATRWLADRARQSAFGSSFDLYDGHVPRDQTADATWDSAISEFEKEFPDVDRSFSVRQFPQMERLYRLAATVAGDFRVENKSEGKKGLSKYRVKHEPRTDSPGAGERASQAFGKDLLELTPEERQQFIGIFADYMQQRKTPERSVAGKISERLKRGEYAVGEGLAATPAHLAGGDVSDNTLFMQQVNAVRRGMDKVTSDNLFFRGLLGAAEMTPALAASAITPGGGVGATGFWFTQTYPGLYQELRSQGINEDVANGTAMIGAIPIAAIETIQFGRLKPGLQEEAKAVAAESMKKYLLGKAKEGGITYAKEMREEFYQGLMEVGTKAAAHYLDDKAPGMDWGEELGSQVEQLTEAALALPFIMAPGQVVDTTSGALALRRDQQAQAQEKERAQGLADFQQAFQRGQQQEEAAGDYFPFSPKAKPKPDPAPFATTPEYASSWADENPEAAASLAKKVADGGTVSRKDFTDLGLPEKTRGQDRQEFGRLVGEAIQQQQAQSQPEQPQTQPATTATVPQQPAPTASIQPPPPTQAPAPQPSQDFDQQRLANIRSRLRYAQEQGVPVDGIAAAVEAYENGDRSGPSLKDTLAAINIAIADHQKRIKQEAQQQPAATEQPPPPPSTNEDVPPTNPDIRPQTQPQPAPQPEAQAGSLPPPTNKIEFETQLSITSKASDGTGGQFTLRNAGPGKGWIASVVRDGVRTEFGGDPRGGGFSREEAVRRASREASFQQPAAEEKPPEEAVAPPAPVAEPTKSINDVSVDDLEAEILGELTGKPEAVSPPTPPEPKKGLKKKKPKLPALSDKGFGHAGSALVRSIAQRDGFDVSDPSDTDAQSLLAFAGEFYRAGFANESMPSVTMHPEESHRFYRAGQIDGGHVEPKKKKKKKGLNKKPEAAPAPPATTQPAAEQSPGDKALAEANAAAAKLAELFKTKLFSVGADPELIVATAKVTALYVKAGVIKFSEFIAKVRAVMGDEVTRKASGYLRKSWDFVRTKYPDAKMDESVEVEPLLAPTPAPTEDATDATSPTLQGPPSSSPSDSVQGADGGGDSRPASGGNGERVPEGAGTIREGGDEQHGSKGTGDAGLAGAGEREGGEGGGKTPQGNGERGGEVSSGENDDVGAGVRSEEEGQADVPSGEREDDGKAGEPRDGLSAGNFRIDPEEIGQGGPKAKYRDNVAAIRLLKQIQAEGRSHATRDEQAVLAKYVGWGMFPGVFRQDEDESNAWDAEREEIASLLTEDEWRSAHASTTNAHYTSPQIVTGMWEMLDRLGFKAGRVIEPSAGVGNFIGLQPASMAGNSKWSAVEMDRLTGSILSLLYPDAKTRIEPYQDFSMPDNFYDLAISNVPFENTAILSDKRYKKYRPFLHDYFFLKTLDKIRPGGVMAFITSTGTMDKGEKGLRIRELIAEKADLVSAMRLPENTFGKNAGTAVVTDLIILRKRGENEAPSGPSWVGLSTVKDPDGGADIPINEYYASHPEQVLGIVDRKSRMYAKGEPHVSRTDDFEQLWKDAIERLPENILTAPEQQTQYEPKLLGEGDEPGQFVYRDGKLYEVGRSELYHIPPPEDHPTSKAATTRRKNAYNRMVEMVKDFAQVRHAARDVVNFQLSGKSPEERDAARKAFERWYDKFVKKHGFFNSRQVREAIGEDVDYDRVASAEDWNEDTETAEKGDFFRVDTVVGDTQIDHADSIEQAIAASLNRSGRLDVSRMAELLGESESVVEGQLREKGIAYEDPSAGWVTADEYLSGNVRVKLIDAEAAASVDDKFKSNVEALRKVIPADKPYEEIDVKANSPWLPLDIVPKFAAQLLGGEESDFELQYVESTGDFHFDLTRQGRGKFDGEPVMTEIWGTPPTMMGSPAVPFDDIMDSVLSGQKIILKVKTLDGDYILDNAGTEAANAKVEEVKEEFQDWIWADPTQREQLVRRYNDHHNAIVKRKFDGSHLTFPGMAPPGTMMGSMTFKGLRPHQANAVWRTIVRGKAIYGHEVGTGKTMTMVASAMELRRLGLANKPAIVVPDSRVEATAREAMQLYPGARILTAARGMNKADRRKTVARIASGNWDIVILTQENLRAIPISPQLRERYIREQLREIEDLLRAEGVTDAEMYDEKAMKRIQRGNVVVKKLAKMLASANQRLRAATDLGKDTGVSFEETGIDFMFVDEAHNFKSLPVRSRLGNVKGIPSSESDRAVNFEMIASHLQSMNNGRGIVLATGTPITNSLAELYVMQRYVQRRELEQAGILPFDAWASTFGSVETRIEFNHAGTESQQTRFREFTNIQQLSQLASLDLDIVRVYDDPLLADKLQRPERVDEIVAIEQSERQRQYMRSIAARAQALRGPPQKGGDNHLKISTDGTKAAIDIRLVMEVEEDEDTKVKRLAANILRIRKDTPDGTQMVFFQAGRSTDPVFDIGEDLTAKLVAGGIPRDKILDFRGVSSDKKDALIQRLKTGDAWVAMGNTQTLGTGVNAQDYLVAIHHLEPAWTPESLEQRNGRGWRQGNRNSSGKINIITYLVAGSLDSWRYGLVAIKARGIEKFMLGKFDGNRMVEEDAEDFTYMGYEKMQAVASGNPLRIEFINVNNDVEKLERAQLRWQRQKVRISDEIRDTKARQKSWIDRLEARKKDKEAYDRVKDADFSMEVRGTIYTDRKQAAAALGASYRGGMHSTGIRLLGEYRGFEIMAKRVGTNFLSGQPLVDFWLQGEDVYEFSGKSLVEVDPAGAIQSIDYALRHIGDKINYAQAEIDSKMRSVKSLEEQLAKPWRDAEKLRKKTKLRDRLRDAIAQGLSELPPEPKETKPFRKLKPKNLQWPPRRDRDDADDQDGEYDSDTAMGSPLPPEAAGDPGMPSFPGANPASAATSSGPVIPSMALTAPAPGVNVRPIDVVEVMDAIRAATTAFGKDIPIRIGRFRHKALGIFKVFPEVVRLAVANDIGTAAHEIGHAVEKLVYGWKAGGPWKGPRVTSKMQRELTDLGKALYLSKQPVGGYKREGFAEFMRLYITDPAAAKSLAPDFYNWFEGTFLKASPAGEKALSQAQQKYQRYSQQASLSRGRENIVDPQSLRSRAVKFSHKFEKTFSVAGIYEEFDPLYKAEKEAEAASQATRKRGLSIREKPYTLAATFRGQAAGRVSSMIENGMIDINGTLTGVQPLRDIEKLVPMNKRVDFTVLLWALRAKALLEDPMGPRNPGMSLDDAKQIIKDVGTPALLTAATIYHQWNDGVLDYAAGASYTFAEAVRAIRRRDPGSYAPLRREFAELERLYTTAGGGDTARGTLAGKLKGSGRRIIDPIQSAITQAEQIVEAAHDRMVLEAVMRLERIEGMGGMVENVPVDRVPAASRDLSQLIEEIADRLKNKNIELFDQNGDPIDPTDHAGEIVTFFAFANGPKPGEPIIPVWEGGSVRWYQVDPGIYTALKPEFARMTPVRQVIDWAFATPGRITAHTLRMGATGLNPGFAAIVNTIRDTSSLYHNTQSGASFPRIIYEMMKMLPVALADALSAGRATDSKAMRKLAPATTEILRFADRVGIEMAQSLNAQSPFTRRTARRIFEGQVRRIVDLRNWLDYAADVLQFSDKAARAVEGKLMAEKWGIDLSQPLTLEQSINLQLAMKQVTTDFSATGSWAKHFTQFVPFMRSALQGPRAAGRALKRDPVTYLIKGMATAALAIGLWWRLKDEDWWEEMDPNQKLRHFHIPVTWGGRKEVLQIPVNQDADYVFGTGVIAALDSLYKQNPKAAMEWAREFIKSMNPVSAPPLMEEIYEQAANRDTYFDTQIVPEELQARYPAEQYNENTPALAKWLGETAGISPMRIEHAVTGLGGGVARDAMRLGSTSKERESEPSDMFMLGRLFVRGGPLTNRPKAIGDFYDLHREAEAIKSSVKTPETEDQRQRRLILDDARSALASISNLRADAYGVDERRELMHQKAVIAEEAMKAYKADKVDRVPLAAVRKAYEYAEKQASDPAEAKKYRAALVESTQAAAPKPGLGWKQRQEKWKTERDSARQALDIITRHNQSAKSSVLSAKPQANP